MCLLIKEHSSVGIRIEKTPVNKERFTNYFSNNSNYELYDASSQFLNNEVHTVLIAMGETYAIEFYDLVNDKITLNICRNIVESNDLSITPKNDEYLEYYYETVKNETFYILAKVDNTIVFTYAPKKYKAEIIGLLKDLGY